jgi:UrcA family protein
MLRTFATAALLALSVTAAQAGDAPPSVNVAFGDLNLSHPADAKILAGRLQAAAIHVCHDATDGLYGVAADHVMRECVRDAIDVALAHIASSQTNAVRANLVSDRVASN